MEPKLPQFNFTEKYQLHFYFTHQGLQLVGG